MDKTPEQSHAHAAEHNAADHVNAHVKGYLLVGGLLMVFTFITVGLSYVNFGTPQANIVVALIVASIKASLVALIFMHLKSEKWTIYRFLLITVFFAIGLFALTALAFSDPIRLNF
jgi:cytochrome c oxidase subunit 4